MMYASKINVDHNPKIIKKTKAVDLSYGGTLTISYLKSLGITEHQEFDVYGDDDGNVTLSYGVSRLETPEEVSERIKKEIKYNENYEKFHAKHRKNK